MNMGSVDTVEKNGDVRKRKKQKSRKDKSIEPIQQDSLSVTSVKQKHEKATPAGPGKAAEQTVMLSSFTIFSVVNISVALLFMFLTGYWFAWYMETLHENNMWFTNIQQVEQEISLRTECGLYYSYFKQLVPTVANKPKPEGVSGLDDFVDDVMKLTVDNATEHGHSVNILARFNVYQEVFLAAIYRYFGLQGRISPILFYIYSIFKLNGVYVSLLFAAAWYASGTWLAGLVAFAQFVVNLDDTTRVFFSINLRENFAFPFFAGQLVCLLVFLERSTPTPRLISSLVGFFVFTFLGTISWQFSQFVLLLQAASIYALGLLQLAPTHKLRNLLFLLALAQILVGFTQFGQKMIFCSLLLSFVPVAIAMLYAWKSVAMTGGILEGSFRIGCQVCCVFALTLFVNSGIKHWLIVDADADQHIFKFIKAKFGFGSPTDFESRIYLCHGAFMFLDNEFFRRTTHTLLNPLFFASMLGFLFVMGKNVLLEWCAPVVAWHLDYNPNVQDVTNKPFMLNQRPNIAYLTIHSAVTGILALMTLRMKYLWTPHMIVLSSVGLCDEEVWMNILSVHKRIHKIRYAKIVRNALVFCVLLYLGIRYGPVVRGQLNDLREFYDPDTVELMNWITNNTDETASFAGSMQLLAGVKACTNRHLTNHPHFEDKWLRDRTKQVYQIYGRRRPEEVYHILRSMDAHYFILEDSICLAPSDNCRLPDLIDLDAGIIPENNYAIAGLRASVVPRFCDEIRYGDPEYTRYFRMTLQNRTFRLYRVLEPDEVRKEIERYENSVS